MEVVVSVRNDGEKDEQGEGEEHEDAGVSVASQLVVGLCCE